LTIERGDVYVINDTKSGLLTGFIVVATWDAFWAHDWQGKFPTGASFRDWIKRVRGIDAPDGWQGLTTPDHGFCIGTAVPLPAGASPEKLQEAWNQLTADIEKVIEKPLYLSTIVDGRVILYSELRGNDDGEC